MRRVRYLVGAVFALWCGTLAFGQGGVAPAAGAGGSSSSAETKTSAAPDQPEALIATRRLIDTGHPQQALDKLAADSHGPGVERTRGLALYALNRLPEADAAFRAALLTNPHDQESAQMRALTLFRQGKPAEAIPLLEGAQQMQDRGKVDPSYLLALCYMDVHRYEDARRAFAGQYGLPPDSAAAYLLAARMLFRREYVLVAKEFATKAVTLDGQMPLVHGLLGEIALSGNHLDEAIAELEKERQRNPLEGSVYDRLGDAYYRAARYPEAQQSLQRAVLLEPNSTGPYILLGKVLLKRQDPVGALTYLQRAAAMDDANYMTHSLLAQAYRGLGRSEDAARETAAAEKLRGHE